MRGSEKQVAYAEDILAAIEAAEQPSYEDSDRPRGKISLDREVVARDQEAVDLIRAADEGATAGELQERMQDLDDEQAADVLMSCIHPDDRAGLQAEDTVTIDAGAVIDTLQGRYHAMYGEDGRLS